MSEGFEQVLQHMVGSIQVATYTVEPPIRDPLR